MYKFIINIIKFLLLTNILEELSTDCDADLLELCNDQDIIYNIGTGIKTKTRESSNF